MSKVISAGQRQFSFKKGMCVWSAGLLKVQTCLKYCDSLRRRESKNKNYRLWSSSDLVLKMNGPIFLDLNYNHFYHPVTKLGKKVLFDAIPKNLSDMEQFGFQQWMICLHYLLNKINLFETTYKTAADNKRNMKAFCYMWYTLLRMNK